MDIEGAEFELLLHLYKRNCLDLIDQMAIEYHEYISPFTTSIDILNFLMKKNNVKVIKWI